MKAQEVSRMGRIWILQFPWNGVAIRSVPIVVWNVSLFNHIGKFKIFELFHPH